MLSNIIAYEWPLTGTKQVTYITGDDRIREMAAGHNERWSDIDVTDSAGAPRIALETAIMSGYGWPDGRTKQVAYVSPVDSNGHVHELVMLEGKAWSYADLMDQVPGAPPADGISIAGYSWKTRGTKQVVYTGANGHIHELAVGVTGMWRHSDLTQLAGAPLVEGAALVSYTWETEGTKQVAYMSGDGHIHELIFGKSATWSHTDLTQEARAPLADGSALAGYTWEAAGTKQVVYIGNDRHIYELVMGKEGTWRFMDLMRLTGAPLPDGSALAAYAWETGLAKQVAYVSADGHIQDLVMGTDGHWKHTDLTQLTGAPEADNGLVVGYEWTSQYARQIVFLDKNENPHIHELMLKHGGSWRHTDLTRLTGAPEVV